MPMTRSFCRSALAAALLLPAAWLSSRCSEPEADSHPCPDDTTQILLIAPKGGETFHVGDSLRVKWKLCNAGPQEITAVDIELSPNDGADWPFIRTSSMPIEDKHFGTYAWKITDSVGLAGEYFQLKNNPKCRVRVEQYSTSEARQRSTSGLLTIQ